MRAFTVVMVAVPFCLLVLGGAGPARAGETAWTPPAPMVAAQPAAGEPVAVAVASAEPEPELAMMGPAPPPVAVKSKRRAAKRCGKGKPCRKPGRTPPPPTETELRLQAAASLRAEVLATADAMVKAGRTEAAAAALGSAAEAHADPVLHLAAVEAELADPTLGRERLRLALARTRTARALVEHPAEPRLAAGEGPALLERSDVLAGYTERRIEGLRLHRRGRAQVISGAVLLTASLGGVAALASGAALGGRIDAAAASYTGSDAVYIAALGSAREQATVRMAAGAVVGLLGAAAGIPLSISGARDLQAARVARKERPTLRIAPGFAALSLTGRF